MTKIHGQKGCCYYTLLKCLFALVLYESRPSSASYAVTMQRFYTCSQGVAAAASGFSKQTKTITKQKLRRQCWVCFCTICGESMHSFAQLVSRHSVSVQLKADQTTYTADVNHAMYDVPVPTAPCHTYPIFNSFCSICSSFKFSFLVFKCTCKRPSLSPVLFLSLRLNTRDLTWNKLRVKEKLCGN